MEGEDFTAQMSERARAVLTQIKTGKAVEPGQVSQLSVPELGLLTRQILSNGSNLESLIAASTVIQFVYIVRAVFSVAREYQAISEKDKDGTPIKLQWGTSLQALLDRINDLEPEINSLRDAVADDVCDSDWQNIEAYGSAIFWMNKLLQKVEIIDWSRVNRITLVSHIKRMELEDVQHLAVEILKTPGRFPDRFWGLLVRESSSGQFVSILRAVSEIYDVSQREKNQELGHAIDLRPLLINSHISDPRAQDIFVGLLQNELIEFSHLDGYLLLAALRQLSGRYRKEAVQTIQTIRKHRNRFPGELQTLIGEL